MITGEFAASDNAVIFLNGASTGVTTPADGFGSFTSFTISSGFVPGVNTLEFQVTNTVSEESGPSLQVNDLSGTATPIPEPVSLLLFGAGLVGMAVIGRKNRKEEV